MAKRKRAIPQYGTVELNGIEYYRTRVQDADGKLVALYARTPEENRLLLLNIAKSGS